MLPSTLVSFLVFFVVYVVYQHCGLLLHPKGHLTELTSGIHPGAKLCKAIQGLCPSTDEGIFSDDKAAVGADPGVGASNKL